ncbi:MAG: hypothetical protein K6F83_07030 [Clostridiales bacterium]|nr:hypothetical protein [Clostridiales bacterium]
MKKLVCCVLALTCFLGVYFTAPKSAGSIAGTKVCAAARKDREWFAATRAFTVYYYTSSGSRRSVSFKKYQSVLVYNRSYFIVPGSNGEQYRVGVSSQISNGYLACIE